MEILNSLDQYMILKFIAEKLHMSFDQVYWGITIVWTLIVVICFAVYFLVYWIKMRR